MKYFLLLVLLTSQLFYSCKHEKKITPEVKPDENSTEESGNHQNVSRNEGKIFKGLFVVGKNIQSFRECDHADRDFAVVDSTGKMKQLYKTVFLHSPAF